VSKYLDMGRMSVKGIGKPEKICLVAMAAVIFAYLYWYGAERMNERNAVLRLDQRSYLGYAKNIYEMIHEGEDYYGDGARMPVYPFLQSLIYDPGLTDEAYFVRGKYFNIALSFIALVGIFLILKKHFPWLYSVNLVLITAFTVFVFNAASFHAELAFYFMKFCVFLLMRKMLDSPSWKLGILTGVMLGVAHLTKASVMLGLGLFLACASFKTIRLLYLNLTANTSISPAKSGGRALVYQIVSIILVVVCFLTTVYPYISASKKRFGKYFYNVSTDFYMWYDSWEEAKQGKKRTGIERDGRICHPTRFPVLASICVSTPHGKSRIGY
jgi:hypothetical protein